MTSSLPQVRPLARSQGAGNATAVLLIPLLGVLWGFNWPAVKIALGEIAPWTLRTTGMLLGGLVLVALALLRGRSLYVPPAHWLRLTVAGILSIASFNVLLAFAQLMAPTSRAAVVTFAMPIWASLIAWPVLGERPTLRRIFGLVLCLAGLAALGLPLIRTGQLSLGLFLALGAGVSWAGGTIVTKRYPVDARPLTVAAWQLLVGALAGGIGMLVFEGVPVPHLLGRPATLALVYHVLFAQALAYFLWFEIIPRMQAGAASLGTLMVPAFGVLGAMVFVGERPTLADYLGLVLIIGAAATVVLPGPTPKPPPSRGTVHE